MLRAADWASQVRRQFQQARRARMMIRRLFMTLAAGAPLLLGADAALAADDAYPTGLITMVVPYAAGGPTQTGARLVAESMIDTLSQQVIVEDRGGGRRRLRD